MLISDSVPLIAGRHIPELDGVRGIAIALVLIFHCSSIAAPSTTSEHLYVAMANIGWIGVDLFFVLSGFLITAILLDSCDSRNYFSSFYMRRVLRIFPLYYASVALWTLAIWFSPSIPHELSHTVSTLSYWLYLQNWLPLVGISPLKGLIHFWSLAVEEQFYLIWPILIRFTVNRGRAQALCLVTALLALMLRAILVLLGAVEVAFYFTLSRIDALAIGAYVAVCFKCQGTLIPFRRSATFLFLLASMIVLLIMFQQQGFYNLNPLVLLLGVFPLGIVFGCFLIILLTRPGFGLLRVFFRNTVLQVFGRISYGIYVFHWPIMLTSRKLWPDFISDFWLRQILFLAFVTMCSMALAYVSFRYFESPILRQKSKLAPYNERDTV